MERKQPEMTHADRAMQLIRELLEFNLPELDPSAVAPAAVCGDMEPGPFAVTLSGIPEDMAKAETVVDPAGQGGPELTVQRSPREGRRCLFFCNRPRLHLHVSMPALDSVRLTDAARGNILAFSGSTLTVDTMDAGRAIVFCTPATLEAILRDASRVVPHGSARTLHLTMDGAGSVTLTRRPAASAPRTSEAGRVRGEDGEWDAEEGL
jgi:hypothetical protein